MSKLTVRLTNMLKLLSNQMNNDHIKSLGTNFIRLQIVTFLKTLTNYGLIDGNGGDGCCATDGGDARSANKLNKYWSGNSVDKIIEQADELYIEGKYLEVYEILNRLKYSTNLEIKWRVARILFKLSCQHKIGDVIKKEMIGEAYDIITSALKDTEDNESPVLHKWAAIIKDRKYGIEGLEHRVRNSEIVKNHLIRCCELDPNDVTAQYLLGRWCYEMSNITWFQRIISKLLYSEPPTSSYHEAHKYLTRVEDLQPKFYLQNTFLLGKTCLKLGQYYKAKYYFEVVENLPAHNEHEKGCIAEAKKLLKKLDKYSLEQTRSVLLSEYPFGINE